MSMIGYLLPVSTTELEAYLKDSNLLEVKIDELMENESSALVDIDKSWDGINFLLTGGIVGESDHPLGKVLFSMQYIDEDQDLGYGPGNYLSPQQVKELNEEISKITIEALAKKYDSKKMTALELYPNFTWEDDDMVNYLTDYFKVIQQAYALAAKEDQAIITFLG